ncbi:MAG: hypothetical protein K2J77_04705 [Oscillospiraceae bacterium]|nr:hypothetical protein [Oscillospiraceae bacterium]
MLREQVEELCEEFCRGGRESHCAFASGRGIIGFIDTSGARDGSRGIAFFEDRFVVNTDGRTREIPYKSVDGLRVISSFEDSFADELSITAGGEELRISDYSLDKDKLKRLLEELCGEQYSNAHLPEHEQPFIEETVLEILPENLEKRTLPEGYEPAPIPEDNIDWISGGAPVITEEFPAQAIEQPIKRRPKPLPEVMNGVIDRIPVIGSVKPIKPTRPTVRQEEKAPEIDEEYDEERGEITESELRARIENMSPDEVMKFLSDTMNEINAINESSFRGGEAFFDTNAETHFHVEDVRGAAALEGTPIVRKQPAPRWKKLTVEPIWGDIYIKASQKLRELCESGWFLMEQYEAELKERLIPAAEAFESLTSDSARVPKVLIPKITELKAAADNFDYYFKFGEDIAIRAMFFMLYQMLTYADRIAESPETKERLNDFFRRFGSAGITLSMLDMRG